jgi:hypothetical protein
MKTYPIQNKTDEENVIKHIMTKNQYPKQTFHKFNSRSHKIKNYNFQSSDKTTLKNGLPLLT